MRIPLPKLLRHWRERAFASAAAPPVARRALGLWLWFASRPRAYRLAAGLGARVLGALGRRRGRFASLPLASGWTKGRDLPAPEGRTFHALWRDGRRR